MCGWYMNQARRCDINGKVGCGQVTQSVGLSVGRSVGRPGGNERKGGGDKKQISCEPSPVHRENCAQIMEWGPKTESGDVFKLQSPAAKPDGSTWSRRRPMPSNHRNNMVLLKVTTIRATHLHSRPCDKSLLFAIISHYGSLEDFFNSTNPHVVFVLRTLSHHTIFMYILCLHIYKYNSAQCFVILRQTKTR